MSGYAEKPFSDPRRLTTEAHFIAKPFTSERLVEAIRLARRQHTSRDRPR
jgi:FixJ family two-component response regulator